MGFVKIQCLISPQRLHISFRLLLQKCSVEYKLSLKYFGRIATSLLREKPCFPWAVLHPYRTTAKKLIITDLECSSVNTASNWISSFIFKIVYKNLIKFEIPEHRYGLHLSPQHRFNLYILRVYHLYIVLFPPYIHFSVSLYQPRCSLLKVLGEMRQITSTE